MTGKRPALIITVTVVTVSVAVAAALLWHFMSADGPAADTRLTDGELQAYREGLTGAAAVIGQYNDRCEAVRSWGEFDALRLDIETARQQDEDGVLAGLYGALHVRDPRIEPLLYDVLDGAERLEICLLSIDVAALPGDRPAGG